MTTQPDPNQDSSRSTRTLLLGIWSHLSRRRRIQLGLLFLVMIASGVAELISLGSVLPFLSVLNDPELLWKQSFVRDLAAFLGLKEAAQLLLPTTFLFAVAAVFAALIRLVNIWLNGRFASAVGSDLSCEAYRRTLYQSYEVHLQQNTASQISTITTQIGRTVAALNALLQLLTSGIVAFGLFAGLLLIDASVAVAAASLFGGSYAILAVFSRRELRVNGEKITEASTLQLKALQEGLGAIRDVLLDGSQATYLQLYGQADRPLRQLLAKNSFIAAFPRYTIEALGMVAIALLGGLFVVHQSASFEVIPLLGALALGAQRLLPALQQVYSSWASLKGFNAAILAVLKMLGQPMQLQISEVEELPFNADIRLEQIRLRYAHAGPEILRGLDIQIKLGECIGLIGSTGSGKTTAIDILMGLLAPTSGKILVDGVDLHDPDHPERLLAWRASIAHVPQSIYLADTSIAQNIAFGVPSHQIDLALVKQAADLAQISSFIESSPQGYDSFVGERGVRLSGGQRQRIGIARALYKKARVLVLDEATSALDNQTEEAVIDSINAIGDSPTVIMIAHRLSTLLSCDRVIRLEQGSVSLDGPPKLVLSSQA